MKILGESVDIAAENLCDNMRFQYFFAGIFIHAGNELVAKIVESTDAFIDITVIFNVFSSTFGGLAVDFQQL